VKIDIIIWVELNHTKFPLELAENPPRASHLLVQCRIYSEVSLYGADVQVMTNAGEQVTPGGSRHYYQQ